MDLKLLILPVESHDKLFAQKCLLSEEQFVAPLNPGQWVKCNVYNDLNKNTKNYAVCKIFPRDDIGENFCRLDPCVSTISPSDNNEQNALLLHSIEPFSNTNVIDIPEVDVIIFLKHDFYTNNYKNFTISNLRNITHTLLQSYTLTASCIVRCKELQNFGIDSVHIATIQEAEGSFFVITDQTIVNIKNVLLKNIELKSEIVDINIPSFKRVQKELNDFLHIVKRQRSDVTSFRISLNLLLIGASGSGKTTLIENFVKENKCNVFRINSFHTTSSTQQYPGDADAELRKIFKAASYLEKKLKSKAPTVILLDDLHLLCPQQTKITSDKSTALRSSAQLLSLVDELYSSKTEIFCIASTSNADAVANTARRPGRFEQEIQIGILTEIERYEIIKKLLNTKDEQILNTSLGSLVVQTQGYVISDLELLMRNVVNMLINNSTLNINAIFEKCLNNSTANSLKNSDICAYRTKETFDSIGGMPKLKRTLEVSILACLKQKAFLRFGLTLPKGILLYGPPGCGKTCIAKCIATEANMTFLATSGAELYSPYVGCAEKYISKMFDTARKNAPCLIFLDEIDSLVGRRTIDSGSSGDVQIRILSTLLTEMDGIISVGSSSKIQEKPNILVVAATNRPDAIDDALLRPGRFDKLVHVPAPDIASRKSILELYSKRMPFSNDLNLNAIAERTENYSGADICNICNEAAMEAFQRDFNANTIENVDFQKILETTKSSLSSKQINWYYQFENKVIQ